MKAIEIKYQCNVCGSSMKESIAYKNRIEQGEEGTRSRRGKAIIIKVIKCPNCGHSFEK